MKHFLKKETKRSQEMFFFFFCTGNPLPTEISEFSSSEESISSRVQEILMEKLNIKPKKTIQPPSLLSKTIVANPKRNADEPKYICISDSSKERESRKASDGKHKESTKSENSKVKFHRSESWAGHDNLGHDASTSNACNKSSSISKSKQFNRSTSSNPSILGNESNKSSLNREIKPKRQEAHDARSETSKPEASQRPQGEKTNVSQSNSRSKVNLCRSSSLNTDVSAELENMQRMIEEFKKGRLSAALSVSSTSVDSRPHGEELTTKDASMIKEVKSDPPGVCKNSPIPAPPLPPPLPLTSPPLPPLPPSSTLPLSPLPTTISPFLNQSPIPSTPESITKQSWSLTGALQSVFSTWPSKNNTSGVSTVKSDKATESSSSSSTWSSPPCIERKGMLIPGLEPPGSPVFNLIKDKQVLSITKGRQSNIVSSKGHPSSLAEDTKAIAPSPTINPQPIPFVQMCAQNVSSENVTSPLTIEKRSVTVAEQTALAEAKKKIKAILEQSAQSQKDANFLSEKVSFGDSGHIKLKSILKTAKLQSEAKQENVSEKSNINRTALNDVSSAQIAPCQDPKESSVKVVSLNEYRQKQKQQNSSSAPSIAKTLNIPCTSNPKIKSGLDLVGKLLSTEKGQASPDAKIEPSKDTHMSTSTKSVTSGDKGAKDSSSGENEAPKKRRRIVTVKRKSQERSCGYDDMTSDISDGELSDEKITSDISDTELPDDYTEPGWYDYHVITPFLLLNKTGSSLSILILGNCELLHLTVSLSAVVKNIMLPNI